MNANQTFRPTTISAKLSAFELTKAIDAPEAKSGVLLLTDLPKAPIGEIQSAFDSLSKQPDVIARLNKAYEKNLVYKDSFAIGKGGPKVDMKRVLDLSPERLESIRKNDPNLVFLQDGSRHPLAASLDYWEHLRTNIVRAIADAVGSEDISKDAAFNYRIVDYYERNSESLDAMSLVILDPLLLFFPVMQGSK